jgi:hypothetical protein
MTATAATLAGARRLYVVAGLSAFLAMLANVADIMLGFGGEMVTYGAKPAAEWFDVFRRSPFEGLYALGILNIVYMLGMLRGRVFSRINAWAGIAGFSCLTLFTFVATFVQAWRFTCSAAPAVCWRWRGSP